jgi:plastocyanin
MARLGQLGEPRRDPARIPAMTTSLDRQRGRALALVIGLALLGSFAVQSGSAAGQASATASAAKRVSIRDFAFHPGTLTVKRGAQVAFANASNVTHTATKAGSFDTKQIKPGTTKVVTFGKRGTFAYHCSIHPFMKGKVIVE